MFQKGRAKTGGKPRGYKAPEKKLLRVADILANLNRHPVTEIIQLIPALEPEDQLKAWTALLRYVQAPPVGKPEEDEESQPTLNLATMSDAELEKLAMASVSSIVPSVSERTIDEPAQLDGVPKLEQQNASEEQDKGEDVG